MQADRPEGSNAITRHAAEGVIVNGVEHRLRRGRCMQHRLRPVAARGRHRVLDGEEHREGQQQRRLAHGLGAVDAVCNKRVIASSCKQ